MISSSAKQAEEARESAKIAADTAQTIQKKIRNWSIVGIAGVVGVALTAIAITVSVYTLIYGANSRYDGMVQDIKDCTYQISTLEQQLEILQKKLDFYEITQPTSFEQHSEALSPEESGEDASQSSGGEETSCEE